MNFGPEIFLQILSYIIFWPLFDFNCVLNEDTIKIKLLIPFSVIITLFIIKLATRLSMWIHLIENLDMQLDRLGGLVPAEGGGRRSTLIVAPRVRRRGGGALCWQN